MKWLVLLHILAWCTQGMHWTGNTLSDLEFQGLNFIKEAELWETDYFDVTIKTSECSDTILGGPSINNPDRSRTWLKTYKDLPIHVSVRFQVKFYPVDSWDKNQVDIELKGTSRSVLGRFSQISQASNPKASINYCGKPTPDLPPSLVFFNIPHSDDKIQVRIQSSLTPLAAAGFREIIMTFSNTTVPEINPTPRPCGVAPYDLNPFLVQDDRIALGCTCESSLTMSPGGSGTCTGCHSSCELCNKPGESGCITCKAGAYLTSEGKCANCAANCKTCSGDANYCTTCPTGQFLAESAATSTESRCYPECPKPLTQTQIGTNLFCGGWNCESGQLAYWDGSKSICLTTCSLPMVEKKFASYLVCAHCDRTEYLEVAAEKGSCKSKNVAGQISMTLPVRNKAMEVTFIDKILQADNARFSLFAKDYILNPTWTFFGLNSMGEYSVDNWDTSSSCGCFHQVCGKDCPIGVECHDNSDQNPSKPWVCTEGSQRNNYCWSLRSTGSQKYTAYNLTHISTIALTSYGGPDGVFVSPGFTISNKVGKQNSAFNAIIMQYVPRLQANLADSYRYAENEGRVVTTEHFSKINAQPKMTADLKSAFCNATTMNLPLYLTYHNQEKAPIFHVYTILRKAEIAQLTYLDDQDILSPSGVLEWNNQETFDFLDPCNQQFLTLRKDATGRFFVDLPALQTLSTPDNVICIAVNDVASSQYDLVLYELVIGTSVWKASDRFVGLLSKDYIEELTVRMATKSDQPLSVPDKMIVKVQFHTDIDVPYVQISTSEATTCKVDLSPTCSFDISTSKEFLYAKHSLAECGNYLYEKAGFNCQGVVGYFYPPFNLVKTPISQFTENTTALKVRNEDFSFLKTSYDQQSFMWGLFNVNFWTRWSGSSVLTKLLCIMIIGAVIAVLFKIKKAFEDLKYKRYKTIATTETP